LRIAGTGARQRDSKLAQMGQRIEAAGYEVATAADGSEGFVQARLLLLSGRERYG
jgi:hypothetical protein